MAIDDVYSRLVCGDEELDLHDQALTWISAGTSPPAPAPADIAWRAQGRHRARTRYGRVRHRLKVDLKQAADMARYGALVRVLQRFAEYARLYEEKGQGDPVYWRYKWDSAGPVPLLGLGALQTRVYAITVSWPGRLHQRAYFETPTISGLTLALECDAYWTDTTNQPLGLATGGLVERRRSAGPWTDSRGLQVAEATTNYVLNPSAGAAGNYAALGSAVVERRATTAFLGSYSYHVVTAAVNDGLSLTLAALANADHYVSVWARGDLPDVLAAVLNGVSANGLSVIGTEGDWTVYGVRIVAAQSSGSTTLELVISGADTSKAFHVGHVQVEQKTYSTPPCTGAMGPGHSWSGTAHASTSSRTAAQIAYDDEMPDLIQPQGSACGWFCAGGVQSATTGWRLLDARGASNAERIMLRIHYNDNKLDLYVNGGYRITDVGSGTWSVGEWIFWAVTWDFDADAFVVYVYQDGTLYSDSDTTTLAFPGLTTLTLGVDTGGAAWCNGYLDDVRIFDYVLTAAEVTAIYTAAATVKSAGLVIGTPPYLWTAAGAGVIGNRDDSSGENLAVIGTPRGDVPAAVRLAIAASAGNVHRSFFRQRGFPEFYAILDEHDADVQSSGTDTVDATANAGYQYTVPWTGGSTWNVLTWKLENLPAGSAAFYGRFRLYMRCRLAGGSTTWSAYVREDLNVGSVLYADSAGASVTNTSWELVDLGELTIPCGARPAGTDVAQVWLTLYVTTTSGTQSLEVDYLLLAPVDDEGFQVCDDTGIALSTHELLIDSISAHPATVLMYNDALAGTPDVRGDMVWISIVGPTRWMGSQSTTGSDDVSTTMTLAGSVLSRYLLAPGI